MTIRQRPLAVILPAIIIAATLAHACAGETSASVGATNKVCAGEICARRNTVLSIVARMTVTLRDLRTSKVYNLHGAYIGDADGNSRMRITAESGQLILDLGARGSQIELSLPGKERFFSGTRDDLLNSPRCALSPIARCVNARDLFFPTAAPEDYKNCQSYRLNGVAFFNARESGCYMPRFTRRASVNTEQSAVEQVEWFLRGGISGGRINYSDHRPHDALESLQENKRSGICPRRISITPPGAEFVLEMEVEDLALNSAIPLSKFALAVPAGFKREDLGEALRRNVNVWE